MSMKKFIFVIIALVICLIAVGTFWNLDTRKEHGYGKYQKELAKKTAKINENMNGINIPILVMNYDKYEQMLDDDEIARVERWLHAARE